MKDISREPAAIKRITKAIKREYYADMKKNQDSLHLLIRTSLQDTLIYERTRYKTMQAYGGDIVGSFLDQQ